MNVSERESLIYKWAKHLEVNYYHAGADYDIISRAIGEDNAKEFMELKLNGDQITSLDTFAKSKGYLITWSLYL